MDRVDSVFELNNSAAHIAVSQVATQKDKIIVNTGVAAASFTGEHCSPVSVHYTYDTYSLANITTKSIYQQGGESFYVLALDYAIGAALTKDITDSIKQSGGKLMGYTANKRQAEYEIEAWVILASNVCVMTLMIPIFQ